jgi:hypothetical protein
MNVSLVLVTDEATKGYNCIAWTLGISTSWIWPWGQRNATKSEFDALYQTFGFVPSSSGPIAAFGQNLNGLTHACISGTGHGPRWESKCGAWLRIQHGLAEMEGGTFYGSVLGFYSRSIAKNQDILSATAVLRTMKTEHLSKADLKFIKERVARIDPDFKDRFNKAYQTWKEAWNHPLIVISSNPSSRTQTPAFLDLIALGPGIIPLLMEKLTDSEQFFALQAVDRLLRPEFVISRQVDDPEVLLGEQGRAIDTVKQWIRTEA